jgi:hypothetical protein
MLKLINLMITEIPNESKFCVSYGQLKVAIGPFLLLQHKVPQRGDKDYIVTSLSANMDLELHKSNFLKFA